MVIYNLVFAILCGLLVVFYGTKAGGEIWVWVACIWAFNMGMGFTNFVDALSKRNRGNR